MIQVSQLQFAYDDTQAFALNIPHLELQTGQVYAIIGPNGSGKSTFLNSICSANTAYSGEVKIFGQNTRNLNPQEFAQIRSMVWQHHEKGINFQVSELIEMGAYYSGAPQVRIQELIDEALHEVDMSWAKHRSSTSLSGGELQRVYIAKSLVQAWSSPHSGHWLMLDEPLSFQDVKQNLKISQLLKNWKNNPNQGAVVICHDFHSASLFADQIILFHQGRIIDQDSPYEIFQKETMSQAFGVQFQWVGGPQQGALLAQELI